MVALRPPRRLTHSQYGSVKLAVRLSKSRLTPQTLLLMPIFPACAKGTAHHRLFLAPQAMDLSTFHLVLFAAAAAAAARRALAKRLLKQGR